jgi:putative chitinase
MQLSLNDLIQGTGCTEKVAEVWLPYFNTIPKNFGIDTPLRMAAFLAQVGHESGGLSLLEENLNYSAEGLANVWPKRYAQTDQKGLYVKNKVGRYLPSILAVKIARKPVLIASNTYANRMGNGSVESQEGWKYRGRGILQITGKSNYAELTLNTGIDFISNPDLLKEPAYALISACFFWKSNNLNRFADKKDILSLSKAINGGIIGLEHRKALYAKACKTLQV